MSGKEQWSSMARDYSFVRGHRCAGGPSYDNAQLFLRNRASILTWRLVDV